MKSKSVIILLMIIQIVFIGCHNSVKKKDKEIQNSNKIKTVIMKMEKTVYGETKDGKPVYSFILKNSNGMKVKIIEFGAIVSEINVPDKNGKIDDVVLGYDDLEGWINDPYYFGATIGRVANRIGGAKVVIDSNTYELSPNTLPDFGHNSLHGGVKGYNKVLWKGEEFQNKNEVGVVLTYLSPDGEEGYPGNVSNKVTYTLNDNNELGIVMEAITDKTTFVNMTHHSYFNLGGEGNGDILDNLVQINADNYTPSDDDLIPVGDISPVKDLPVDFTTERTVASQIGNMQKAKFKGYDLNYVLNHSDKGKPDFAAKATDAESGRVLEVFTTQPCMHFYTSNFLEGKPGKGSKPYTQYGALCFEPQNYPDAPNKPQFDSVELKPGNKYSQTIIYKFSVNK